MEKLDSILDLLDFTLDCDGVDEKGERKTISTEVVDTAAFGSETRDNSFLDPDAEEELEWLSNPDAFPSIETCFGILSDNPQLLSNHQNSRVSVLGNANANENSNNGNGSAFVVPPSFPLETKKRRLGRKRRVDYGHLLMTKQASCSFSLPSGSSTERRCLHCQANTTPQWRIGPMGPKTLCNACGVRYKSGRLLPEYRPASSPTFSSALHSNSHQKVIQMRNRKQMGHGDV